MSIDLLYDLQQEIRNLFIAGSDIAVDNIKLKKLIPKFQNAGKDIPVFIRISEILESLIESDNNSSVKLLELSGLINAVLYTQGETSQIGQISGLKGYDLEVSTKVSYRSLQYVTTALLEQVPDRADIIRQAKADGIFKDYKLVYPLILALDQQNYDVYNMAYEILRDYGNSIVQVLKDCFRFDGKKGNPKILDLIWEICGKEEKDFFLLANAKGNTSVRIRAINILKNFPEMEDMLIGLTKDRKKEIRETAFEILSHIDSELAAKRLIEAFKGKDRELAKNPIKRNPSKVITKYLLEEAEKCLTIIIENYEEIKTITSESQSPFKETIEHIYNVMYCMGEKKDHEIYEFLYKCIVNTIKLRKVKLSKIFFCGYTTLAYMVVDLLLSMKTVESYALLVVLKDKFDNIFLSYSFKAAISYLPPAKVFDEYSKYLKLERTSIDRRTILDVLRNLPFNQKLIVLADNEIAPDIIKPDALRSDIIDTSTIYFDHRWASFFVENEDVYNTAKYISRNDVNAINYLLGYIEKNKGLEAIGISSIYNALIRIGYPKTIDILIESLDYSLNIANCPIAYLLRHSLGWILKMLPPESAEAIEEYSKKCDSQTTLKLLEAAEAMRKRAPIKNL
ncbi:HEAT repeat domain-containing protein [Pseudobacteroides cellulosolvens]|uniref:HEAT domain containing protein n=1 Tax=Pseudobacteroides cellulosolvens ATCC 35603 = DSM 2933 TaxID=398512 RepID=A0A0L6JTR2_9FIRM|nr:HEAT repeat domain-containing protein [Pseudobacteroides cellulosolvens]KNY29221.1 hypothetical protein Bccel_4495 [Pseudobacteroides cellulosolvens ATCC 35603 = DSM 2933]